MGSGATENANINQRIGTGNFGPLAYAGGESITFPNGAIRKAGYKARTGASTTITFAAAFPNGIHSFVFSTYDPDKTLLDYEPVIESLSVNAAVVYASLGTVDGFYWIAWGH